MRSVSGTLESTIYKVSTGKWRGNKHIILWGIYAECSHSGYFHNKFMVLYILNTMYVWYQVVP